MILENRHVEGLDYTETFAPVTKMVMVRTLLSIAAMYKWEIHQMNVHNVFLHVELHKEVYMKLPPRYSEGHEGNVCKLRKSLYKFKQAPGAGSPSSLVYLNSVIFANLFYYSLFTYSSGSIFLCPCLCR